MLVVLCKDKGQIKDRIGSKDLLNKIRNMHNKMMKSRTYALKFIPKLRAPIHAYPVDANLTPALLKTAIDLGKQKRLSVYVGAKSRSALTSKEY